MLVKLYFVDMRFTENTTSEDIKATLILDETNKVAKLEFTADANLVVRRAARRQAENICRSGWTLSNGMKVGRGFELVEPQENIPDRLLQEGHKYR